MGECNKIYTPDKGTEVELDCESDITSAVEWKILWKDPEGNEGEWIATVANIRFVTYTRTTAWVIPGTWRFMAYVRFPTGYEFHGETALYEILSKFE